MTSTFRTLAPAATVTASVFPSDGLSVGVGQPIVFRFDHYISERGGAGRGAAAISTCTEVAAGARRVALVQQQRAALPAADATGPRTSKVTVSWDLRGWNAGDGMWGDGQGVVHFSVGDARVSFANLATHQMTVTDNGRVVATYPISGGKPTRSHDERRAHRARPVERRAHELGHQRRAGRTRPTATTSSSTGTCTSPTAASTCTRRRGRSTARVVRTCRTAASTSAPTNAQAFFAFSRVGDVVLVGGGPRPPSIGDHGVMDWDTAWNEFAPANAILQVPVGRSRLVR